MGAKIAIKRELAAILGRLELDELELETFRGFVSELARSYPQSVSKFTTADRQTLKALARCMQAAAAFDADMAHTGSATDRMKLAEARQKADNAAKRHMESITALIASRTKPTGRAAKEQAKSLTGFDPAGLV